MAIVTYNDLTHSFFHDVFENNTFPDSPVLQIMEVRRMAKPNNPSDNRFRLRLSDGIFSYSTCINQSQISEKMNNDKLDSGNPVIRLLRYSTSHINESKGANQRAPLVIIDYEVIARNLPILGNPTPHTGCAGDYRGLNPTASAHNSSLQGAGGAQQSHQPAARANPPTPNRGRGNANNPAAQNLTPIKLITPYVNRWRICGVVTAKEEMREIKTAQRGDMKVFNFEITDEQGGCIRLACFNEVAEKFYAIIQKDSMYYVAGGTVKQANKRFNGTGHDYEISLRNDSEVLPCLDREKIEQPKLSLNVVPLSKVASHVNECIDVIAVIDKVNEVQQLTARKSGQPLNKRDLELIDQSETIVVLTLWGEQALNYGSEYEHQTVGIKGAMVREYNGSFSLSTMNSTRIEMNPECNQSNTLYAWYARSRPSVQATSLSMSRVGGGDIYSRDLRIVDIADSLQVGKDDEKGAYFYITGLVSTLKADGALYKSCINEGCKKKVVEIDNQYRCEKCNITNSNYKYVLLLSVEIADFSGTHWVTIFEEQASKMLNKSTKDIGMLLDDNRLDEYNEVFNAVRFRQFVFRVRAKSEFFNDTQRIKWTVYGVDAVDYDKYIPELKKAIEKLEAL